MLNLPDDCLDEAGLPSTGARPVELHRVVSSTTDAAFLCCTHCHAAGIRREMPPLTLAVTIRSCEACHVASTDPMSERRL